MASESDPIEFLNGLSTSEVLLVAAKFGVPIQENLLDLVDPEKLEKARELRKKMLEAQDRANDRTWS